MPTPGKAWFHITLGTYASWLPGDTRGFREREHRIHSSGDHRHPPPQNEHAGLKRYAASIANPATVMPSTLREIVGRKLVTHLNQLGHRVLALAANATHVHLLVELPTAYGQANHEIGRAKQAATLAAKPHSNGAKLWAKQCGIKPIADKSHQRRTLAYIERHRDQGAWLWTFREPIPE